MSIETNLPIICEQISEQFKQSPQNTRRKAELIDRIYVCQYKKCQKAYGSYPALYTHIKLKHSNQSKKGNSNKLPAKNLQYIKRISTTPKMEISTTQSTPSLKSPFSKLIPELKKQSLPELYQNLLLNLHAIESISDSKTKQIQELACPTESFSEEFPSIQALNQDILCPLKFELIQLKSPQTFARFSSSTAGIAHKLAELLAYLGPKIKQELYSEFCYFLGFFAKCITLRKISSMESAEEDFNEIYQYIHDSIGYCTTFRFKYLKNGKILDNKDELMKLIRKMIMNIIELTFQRWNEKILPPFILD